jgi:methylenetetrahydrofolate reductase (NADPH)
LRAIRQEGLITPLPNISADSYFHFIDRASAMSIGIPIISGTLPIANYPKLARFSDAYGAEIPR